MIGIRNKRFVIGAMLLLVLLSGCSQKAALLDQQQQMYAWLAMAKLDEEDTPRALYEAALQEDSLVIYTVSNRVFDVKELFEKKYPGLTVDIIHIRSGDVVNRLVQNYEQEEYHCDLVICSNNDGSLQKQLIEPGIVYSYIPKDIAPKMKASNSEGEMNFLGETLMLFYNGAIYDQVPIQNIWELTEEHYKGKIIMANPLRSFSTYGFCAMLMRESDQIEAAYKLFKGENLSVVEGKTAGEILLERMAPNIVFTNSSDEVAEGIGNSGKEGMAIGIMISSKMRLKDIGYQFEPIYSLEPFSMVYTPNSIMMAGGAKNINTAKLFVRFILGESNGDGEGRLPYSARGTWSTRKDVADGNEVPLSEVDVVDVDKVYLYDNGDAIRGFLTSLLNDNIKE